MRGLKLFIVLGFAIMFVAGLEVGRSHTTLASLKGDWDNLLYKTPASPASTQPSVAPKEHKLFDQIKLTSSQDAQVKQIFADARAHADAISHQFPDIDRRREEEVIAMLDTDQRAEYVDIQHERDAKIAALRAEIAATMKKAGDDVRAILNPDQQKQYDDVHVNWERDHPHRGGRGNPGRGRPRGGPDTAPDHFPETAPAK